MSRKIFLKLGKTHEPTIDEALEALVVRLTQENRMGGYDRMVGALAHLEVLVATDFFTAEVWTWDGLVTYYVLFFIPLGSRRV